MEKAETLIKSKLLIDIVSNGACYDTDQELALYANTTAPYVKVILRQMELSREIEMASFSGERKITYPKKRTNSLW